MRPGFSARRAVFGGLVVAVILMACATIHPPEGKGTSYPCGIWGVECIEGTCCPYGHICGGHRGRFTTCPEGMCCYRGEEWPGTSSDSGSKAVPDLSNQFQTTPQLPRVK